METWGGYMGNKQNTKTKLKHNRHTHKATILKPNQDDNQPHKLPVSVVDKRMESNKQPTLHNRDIQAT